MHVFNSTHFTKQAIEIITGDMLIDITVHNLLTNNYNNLLHELGYTQYFIHHTRIVSLVSDLTNNKLVCKTCIDHTFPGSNKHQFKERQILYRVESRSSSV